MAEVQSPLSGGLRVARRTVSADMFTGRAVPPPVVQPDPVTTTLISRNSLALNTVAGQLQSISQKMDALNGSLTLMSANIGTGAALERQREIQNQNQERTLAEQQLREGKEAVIERKIQSALVSPVQRVAAKASFTLSRLIGFFTVLLSGWLLNQGIETIKALNENNKTKLNDIKNSVVKTLGVIGGIYAAIRFGLVGLYNIITRVVSKVLAAVSNNLFVRPVQALLDGIKGAADKIIPKIKKLLPGFSRTGAAAASAATSAATPFSPSNALLGFGAGIFDMMQGEDPAKAITTNTAAAATVGGLASTASKFVPGFFKVPVTLATGIFGFGPVVDLYKKGYDFLVPKQEASGGPGVDPSMLSQPMNNKITSLSFGSNLDLTGSGKDGIKSAEQGQDFRQKAEGGEINIAQILGTQTTADASSVASSFFESPDKVSLLDAQITPIKQDMTEMTQKVGPLPEPPPTVIPIPPTPAAAAVSAPSGSSSTPANYIPSFATSNPDNFYTLYSQIHYNVVI